MDHSQTDKGMNYLILVAILLVLMALKLTKFIGVAIIVALLVMLLMRNLRPKSR